eukprot:scaffold42128_cov26-Tisochrysis_lutea.AAC.3
MAQRPKQQSAKCTTHHTLLDLLLEWLFDGCVCGEEERRIHLEAKANTGDAPKGTGVGGVVAWR